MRIAEKPLPRPVRCRYRFTVLVSGVVSMKQVVAVLLLIVLAACASPHGVDTDNSNPCGLNYIQHLAFAANGPQGLLDEQKMQDQCAGDANNRTVGDTTGIAPTFPPQNPTNDISFTDVLRALDALNSGSGGAAIAGSQNTAQFGQPVYSSLECVGPIVMGTCQGTILPQSAYHPTCYGTMLNGQCTGPCFDVA